jgi:hypothetical protein
VSCDYCGVVAKATFDDITYEIEFIPIQSIKAKISITNKWPDSPEELKRVYVRDIKALNAFLMLERNPEFRLKLPLDKEDFKDFLKDFNIYRKEIENSLDYFSCEINRAIEKIGEETEDEP